MDVKCTYKELKDIKELVGHPKNPHVHSSEQIDRLAEIIKYQGIRHPIIVSSKSGFIVAGHGRLEALKKLGIEKVPVDFQDFKDEASEYAFIVSDNAIGKDEWAALDNKMILDDIKAFDDFNLDMLGIKDFEIPAMFEAQADEDEVPDTPEEPKSKLGDLYELGEHRLMCGDSTQIDAVEKLMNGAKADMVFTDPPYGLGDRKSFNDDHKDYCDDKAFDLTKLRFESDFVIWGANYYDYLPGPPRTEIGWIVWDKRPTRDTWDQDTRDAADRIFGQHFEIAVTNVKGKRWKMIRKTWGGFYGTSGNPDDSIVHKTQKPIELLTHFIADNHKTVLDYFGGSGSTLIACQKTNRKCYMMELDPHYIDVIVSRWCKYTGQTKIKRNGEDIEWKIKT